ncbi:hypothetical protein AHF37_06966 [Paragonimus kellicotti]|nr:hypothetical protein AHF37_06966 [Paragonimus kellicotti]
MGVKCAVHMRGCTKTNIKCDEFFKLRHLLQNNYLMYLMSSFSLWRVVAYQSCGSHSKQCAVLMCKNTVGIDTLLPCFTGPESHVHTSGKHCVQT